MMDQRRCSTAPTLITCSPDRKSGSAGMPRPRSPLFPYTTLFRSDVNRPPAFATALVTAVFGDDGPATLLNSADADYLLARSEERFSRNAETEISALSLHDALPIRRKSPSGFCHRARDRRVWR